jgi:hypothetical protein
LCFRGLAFCFGVAKLSVVGQKGVAMKIYWGWKDVPELAGLPRSERRKVVRDCFFRFGFGFWQFWVAVSAIYVLAFLGEATGLALRYEFGFPAVVDYACALVGELIGCAIYSVVYYGVLMDRLRPHFRDYIAQRKVHA